MRRAVHTVRPIKQQAMLLFEKYPDWTVPQYHMVLDSKPARINLRSVYRWFKEWKEQDNV
jgi:hypothetical protein